MRESGILLPVSGLPSDWGIGCFSEEAYAFVDWLAQAGQSYWQILPLGPTGYGDSPYQSFSGFAGNPYYIDPEMLIGRGYVTRGQCREFDFGADTGSVDYAKLYRNRLRLLREAFKNSSIEKDPDFLQFCRENESWLEDYALFVALKVFFGNTVWTEWEEDIRIRRKEALEHYRRICNGEMVFCRFQQYLFWLQWKALKEYANGKGIRIIGDLPIYVAFDSADAWAHPELFCFDEECRPVAVAGCPPDAFAPTGQLWGNPLYRWEYHKETDYTWWRSRLEDSLSKYDLVRIDHFRGFDAYYAIPYGAVTAEKGHWEKGPGMEFFRAVDRSPERVRIIAEDLGFLTDSVRDMVRESGYPGMKVLQFAFDSREESDYLPHNYIRNCVAYTGTHDNDTVLGWYEELAQEDRNFCDRYLNFGGPPEEIHWAMIRAALASVADLAVIPMQDYLGLGTKARINTPSTMGENWKWRMQPDALTGELAKRIRELTVLYGRK